MRFSKGGARAAATAMGADLRRDDMEEAAWRFSDATAFRFVEHVLQSVRMVRISSLVPPFARLFVYIFSWERCATGGF